MTNGAGAAPRRVLPAGDTATALGGTAVTTEVAQRGGTERWHGEVSLSPVRSTGKGWQGRESTGNPWESREHRDRDVSFPPAAKGGTVMRIIEQEVDVNEQLIPSA